MFLAIQQPKITFADSLKFPVGTELKLSDVVCDVQFGKLTEPDKVLDSSKKGLIKFAFTLENLLNIQSKREIMIEFYSPQSAQDDDKPDTTEEPVTTTTAPITTTTPATTTTTPTTTTKVPVTTKQSQSGGETASFDPPFGSQGVLIDGTYTTSNGKTLEVKNGVAYVEGILIANKSYSLPKTYTAPYLLPEAEQAYYQMRDAAKSAGFTLTIKSAYRSWNDQNYIFNNYVKRDSLENALTYSARPGHSEHQTGLGCDLVTSSTAESKTEAIKPVLDWLSDNAYQYGFILRYPKGQESVTGYDYEPWHYRYVGVEIATEIMSRGITFEEYLGLVGAPEETTTPEEITINE